MAATLMTVLYDPEIIRSGSLAAAILEFDAQQLRGKVQRAEEVITYRIQELAVDKGNEEERPSAL